MRLDRLFTINVARPLLKMTSGIVPSVDTIPILMYHSISSQTMAGISPYYETITTPSVFCLHMEQLAQFGFQGMSLSQALHWRKNRHEASAAKLPVVITFDDGFEDFHSNAFPILQNHGFNATVFLSTSHIGKHFLDGRPCLSASQVRELHRYGVEFGSHTETHPQLSRLIPAEIFRELFNSKLSIEALTGSPAETFSYPFRFPEEDRSFVDLLRHALIVHGYRAGVTTSIGSSSSKDNVLFLPRLPINAYDDASLFDAKLHGAYDWLRTAQLAVKKTRRKLPASWRPGFFGGMATTRRRTY